MPAALMRTNTSPGPTAGTGTSCNSSGCPIATKRTAFMIHTSLFNIVHFISYTERTPMPKITLIGAGSTVCAKNLPGCHA